MKSPGVSGLGLLVSLGGVLLAFTGVKDVGLVDALRSLAGGVVPQGAGPKVTTVSFGDLGDLGGDQADDDGDQAPTPTSTAKPGGGGGYAGGGAPAVAEAAARYIGTPYRWGGKDPATGLDCSGLVYVAVRDATGLRAPLGSAGQAVWSGFARIDRAEVGAGDVVWWPGHIAVAATNTECISAPRPGLKVRREAIRGAGPAGTGEPTRCLRLKARTVAT